jgi:hypothetical protein
MTETYLRTIIEIQGTLIPASEIIAICPVYLRRLNEYNRLYEFNVTTRTNGSLLWQSQSFNITTQRYNNTSQLIKKNAEEIRNKLIQLCWPESPLFVLTQMSIENHGIIPSPKNSDNKDAKEI